MNAATDRPTQLPGLFGKLTKKQRRFLKAILEEKNHQEICRAARIDRRDFNLYLSGLKQTLMAKTKTGLVIAAVRAGLAPEDF